MTRENLHTMAEAANQKLNLKARVQENGLTTKPVTNYQKHHGVLGLKVHIKTDLLLLELHMLRTAKWVRFSLVQIQQAMQSLGRFSFLPLPDEASIYADLWIRKTLPIRNGGHFYTDFLSVLNSCQQAAVRLQQSIPVAAVYRQELPYEQDAIMDYVYPLDGDLLKTYETDEQPDVVQQILAQLWSGRPVIVSAGGKITHQYLARAIATEVLKENQSVGQFRYPLQSKDVTKNKVAADVFVFPEPYAQDPNLFNVVREIISNSEVPSVFFCPPEEEGPKPDPDISRIKTRLPLSHRTLMLTSMERLARKTGGISSERSRTIMEDMEAALNKFGDVPESTISSLVSYNVNRKCKENEPSNLEMLFQLTEQ